MFFLQESFLCAGINGSALSPVATVWPGLGFRGQRRPRFRFSSKIILLNRVYEPPSLPTTTTTTTDLSVRHRVLRCPVPPYAEGPEIRVCQKHWTCQDDIAMAYGNLFRKQSSPAQCDDSKGQSKGWITDWQSKTVITGWYCLEWLTRTFVTGPGPDPDPDLALRLRVAALRRPPVMRLIHWALAWPGIPWENHCWGMRIHHQVLQLEVWDSVCNLHYQYQVYAGISVNSKLRLKPLSQLRLRSEGILYVHGHSENPQFPWLWPLGA